MPELLVSSLRVAPDPTERQLRYLMKQDIFTHPSCPQSTREATNPLAIPLSSCSFGKGLVPDDLFGIEYQGAKPSYRFFAVEIDRNTESIEWRNLGQTAYGKKLFGYMDAMKSRAYRDCWGVPNLIVLTVTTNATHLENMLAYLRKLGEPKLAERFLFKAKPDFGSNWKVAPIMRDLLAEPWRSTAGALAIDRP